MFERPFDLILRWKYLVLLATLICVAVLASGMRLLEFTTDYRVFFSKQNPQLTAFETLQDTYTKNDNVLFVLAPQDGKVFSRDTLVAVEWLTKQSWQIPYSIRVDSITNFQNTYAEGDDLVVEDLVENAQTLSDAQLERVRGIALAEPLLLHRLISPQGQVTGVNVTIHLPGKGNGEVTEVARFAEGLAERLRAAHPAIDLYLTGMTIMNDAFPRAAQHDMQTLVPIMLLVVLVSVALLLRSAAAMLATGLLIALMFAATMGTTGWLGIKLSPPTTAAPTIMLTLAVADCVHILVIYLRGLRHGLAKYEAMMESLRINMQPVFLTSLTTAVGFMSLNFSDAPPFRNLGNIVAMGVGYAWLFSITLLPALMMILPARAGHADTFGSRVMERLADFVVAQRGRLLWVLSILILVLLAQIPRNALNDTFVEYFDKTVPFRAATDFATTHLTGIYTIEYSLSAGEPGGISNPEFLAHVEAFAQWYRQQPEILHVNSFTDIMMRLNKNLHGDDPAWYRIPEQRDLAAQYLLLYEFSLPFGLDLNNQINVKKSATRFTVTVKSVSTNALLGLEQRARDWLQDNAPEGMQVEGASPAIMFAHIGARNIRAMLTGTTVALVLISLILVVALRSLRIGLLSMVPNLAPIGMAFGLWGMLVGQVGLALSVVSGMTMGVVVDDTVHFLSKFLRARRERGMDAPGAVHYAFSTVGTALWVTSVVLILGFLVLTLSSFKLNADMGVLTAITLALALAADFLFLPPLLIKYGVSRHEKPVPADHSEPAAP